MRKTNIIVVILLAFVACKQRYEPNVRSLDQSFLVVEGNLNAAHDSTIIRLTKTTKLNAAASIVPENNAQLTVEGKDNTIRSLISRTGGYYVSPDLNLTIGQEYRLRIRTSSGKEYLSEYLKAKDTPAIDSVNWERDDEGVHLYVNTTDPSNNSRYYKWDYRETWEIRTYFRSNYVYQNSVVRPRNFPSEDVSVCWKYNNSSKILLANSAKLQNDIIYRMPLTTVPPADEKMQVRYSILVKQYALDKEAYDFYELMKKNTEDIGSFFGPLPSELRGNIYNPLDPADLVVGYLTASVESNKRIFITISGWRFYLNCSTVEVKANSTDINYYFGTLGYMPYEFSDPPPVYYGTEKFCGDCTARGGSTIRPSYW